LRSTLPPFSSSLLIVRPMTWDAFATRYLDKGRAADRATPLVPQAQQQLPEAKGDKGAANGRSIFRAEQIMPNCSDFDPPISDTLPTAGPISPKQFCPLSAALALGMLDADLDEFMKDHTIVVQ
jgi:hypothetical protein